MQGIPLFQAIPESKVDTIPQNLSTSDQINTNKQLYLFLFSKTFPIMSFLFPQYWNDENYEQLRKKNNIWLFDYKILQGITLFQSVSASKDDTIPQNLTTAYQRTPNKWFFLFLFSKTFPMMSFLFPLYLNEKNHE